MYCLILKPHDVKDNRFFIMIEDKIIEMVTSLGIKFEEALEDGRITPSEAIGIAVAVITLLIKVFSNKK